MRQRLPLGSCASDCSRIERPRSGRGESHLEGRAAREGRALRENAASVEGHTPSTNPKPGQIPVLGRSGKLPTSILPTTRSAIASTGAVGATGATGPTGPSQTITTLPSGQTEYGIYAAAAGTSAADFIAATITYARPLAASIPNANVIWNMAGQTTANCPGEGQAAPGYLCLYDISDSGVTGLSMHSGGFTNHTAGIGAALFWSIDQAGASLFGEYAVTAP